MSKKLTLADCFKYPNALVQFIADEIKTGFVNSIFTKDDYQLDIECCPRAFYRKPVSDCQLVLRTIDQLTEDEKKVVMSIWQTYNCSNKGGIDIWYDSNCMTYDYEYILAGDYLRSINIDIDGFIESGKAVKNEKS